MIKRQSSAVCIWTCSCMLIIYSYSFHSIITEEEEKIDSWNKNNSVPLASKHDEGDDADDTLLPTVPIILAAGFIICVVFLFLIAQVFSIILPLLYVGTDHRTNTIQYSNESIHNNLSRPALIAPQCRHFAFKHIPLLLVVVVICFNLLLSSLSIDEEYLVPA